MQIMDYFVEKGLTPEQAAGIVGNMQRESGLDPDARENGGSGPGYGLVQWSFGRRDNLEAYAREQGQPPSDLKTQLDFLWQELNTTERATLDAFRANPNMSATEAAEVFCNKFERPGVVAMGDRTSAANQYLAMYQNGGADGASSTPGGDAPAPSEFNERLASAIERQDANMSGTGLCATAVQRALADCGLDQFVGSGDAWDMLNPLKNSGLFEVIPASEARRGDIIVRPPSANPNDSSIHGDISVVTARNGDNITQTNDASYQFDPNNERYDGRAVFLRYTGGRTS
jgi:hypothetical protein